MKKQRVVVAMSGGVDSSSAASILCEQGYEVIGITMVLWDYDTSGGNIDNEKSCCSLQGIINARNVCNQLKIPHYTINLKKEFEENIIKYFINEYLGGKTPNPCIRCNTLIKWKYLLSRAEKLGARFIATGHYARITFNNATGRYELRKGADKNKEQSYALWGLTQNALGKTLFPLGEWTKTRVRKYAEMKKLKTEKTSESQDICFIRDNNYKRFLLERMPELENKLKGGKIIGKNGSVIGTHDGYPFYTIGQRKGIGVSIGKPAYIYKIDPIKNEIYIGTKKDISGKSMIVNQCNFISLNKIEKPIKAITKIRYKDPGKLSLISPLPDNRLLVEFIEPANSITPGQSAVFYQNDIVIGGGIIQNPL
ncbi:tRNA 2-thiouridine(34) synthase MnmA [candidate division KSB1 bacterium]|nr:MAG: tRNA 2-thiouridine(34) synthase MnmA [candidate division KSB1 bacterium]